MFNHCTGIFRFWTPTLVYLRYQFKQVLDGIREAVQTQNLPQLKKSITDHNYVCRKTFDLNITFNYFLVVFYLLAKPALNVLIYVTLSKQTNPLVRIATSIIFVFCAFCIIFTMNMMCAQVSKYAHSPMKLMYQMSKCDNIATKDKYRIMAFIERLSGPVIGFYCYTLYPINNYQFYEYICGWAYNYFLVIKLIKDYLVE